ncbi:uncharacterized protein P174DRAFT_463510 [Aspergillus novofumigatus IBT 16806]|uniref:HD domain-containing protein n=1 Tax=Aspergillus novofumigatus (strain IBT 16806) TaxID=1392255 RepID=A0A2I1BXD8_ASPN1|nr:uncharacterized protein P174DRAFT_463510 [Aspergillus novofumigatus IBT 16806]PKX90032.1 hypothetical protein P174DRAFT_463510 [Aspergillus novofumigatus IBT 16806]
MALVHDMAECLVALPGRDGHQHIHCPLPGVRGGSDPRRQLVHDIDKLEMVLQTFEYERCHQRDLLEFYHVMDAIRWPEMRDWGLMTMKEREAFRAATSKGEIENDPAKTWRSMSWKVESM